MQAYNRVEKQNYASSSTYAVNGVRIAHSEFWRNVDRAILSNVTSGTGADRKTPRTHRYFKEKRSEIWGSQVTINGVLPARTHVVDTNPGGSSLTRPPTDLDDETLRARVTNDFLSKVRSSDLNAVVSAAESKQTLAMVTKALRSVGRWRREASEALTSLARPLSNGSKRAANKWLEYTYGWVPLFHDVHNLATYSSFQFRERIIKSYSASSRTETNTFGVSPYRQYDQWTTKNSLLIQRRLRITDTTAVDLARLTTLNPLLIAWELMPYSFVVDWVWNVGEYLQNMETACGLGYTVVNGFDTFVSRVQSTSHVYRGPQASDAILSLSGKGSYSAAWKAREVKNSIPWPLVPRLDVNLGARRILSAAALVRQRFRF